MLTIYVLIGKLIFIPQILNSFFSVCVPHRRNLYIPLERCPVDLQKLVIIYISPLGFALEALKVSMLILWGN
jgi:ABC-type multidrug transport system permease subunit